MNSVLHLDIEDEDKLLILKRQISIVEERIEKEKERLKSIEDGCSIALLEELINNIDKTLEEEGGVNNREPYIKEYIKRELGGLNTEEGLNYYKEKRKWMNEPGKLKGYHVKDGKISYKEFFDNQEYLGTDIYGHPLEKPFELYYRMNPILKSVLNAMKKLESKNKVYEFKLDRHNTIIENLLTNVGSLNRKVEYLKKELDKTKI